MSVTTHKTMRLTRAPEVEGPNVTHTWNALFDTYGYETFHPIEALGALRATRGIRRDVAEAQLNKLVELGLATAP